MADRRVAVGAFVLFGTALALGTAIFFGKFEVFNPTTTAAVVFEGSISGLTVGSPVTFRGVRVGAVRGMAIQFDPRNHSAFIPVTVRLEHDKVSIAKGNDGATIDVSEMVGRGLRAELNTLSFVTGQAEIDLDFDPSAPPLFHPGITDLPEIPAKQSAIERVKTELSQLPLHELADNANVTMRSLQALSDMLAQKLPAFIDSATSTSDKAGHAIDSAGDLVRDVQARLGTTLAGIDQLTGTGSRQLSERGAELHALIAATSGTLSDVRGVLANVDRLTADRGAARANLEAMLSDLATAAAALRGFAGDVEHNPQLLLTGRRQ